MIICINIFIAEIVKLFLKFYGLGWLILQFGSSKTAEFYSKILIKCFLDLD